MSLLVKNSILFCYFVLFLLHKSTNAFALSASNTPKIIKNFNKWSSITALNEENDKICYSISNPIRSLTNYKYPRKPYLMLSIFNKLNYEISIISDFNNRKNSIIFFEVDNKSFRFIVKNNNIGYSIYNNDMEIIKYLLGAKIINIVTETDDGKYAVDTYSLDGFKGSYNQTIECAKIK